MEDRAPAAPATTVEAVGPGPAADLVNGFIEAAARLDAIGVESVLDAMLADGTFETVADRHLLPALVALGQAWAAGRLDVAAEHAASHAVLRRLSAAFEAAGGATPPEGSVVVGLPPGARHELGALAFAVAARRAGIPVLYLGPDLPVARLGRDREPDAGPCRCDRGHQLRTMHSAASRRGAGAARRRPPAS